MRHPFVLLIALVCAAVFVGCGTSVTAPQVTDEPNFSTVISSITIDPPVGFETIEPLDNPPPPKKKDPPPNPGTVKETTISHIKQMYAPDDRRRK